MAVIERRWDGNGLARGWKRAVLYLGHVDLLPVPGDCVIVNDRMRVEFGKGLGGVAVKMVADSAQAGRHSLGR